MEGGKQGERVVPRTAVSPEPPNMSECARICPPPTGGGDGHLATREIVFYMVDTRPSSHPEIAPFWADLVLFAVGLEELGCDITTLFVEKGAEERATPAYFHKVVETWRACS